jgi:transposase-like protein
MMLYRGIEVTYETIREWCQKFGQQYANQVRRKRSYVTDKWHLDEMVVTIKKQKYYLWRAVDSEGNVLDVLLKRGRDTEAAKRFLPQTAEETRLCATGDGHRQAEKLRSGKEAGDAACGAWTTQGIKQSSRKLASTDQSARTTNATLQISRTSATICLCC